jgi:hypothetical protein
MPKLASWTGSADAGVKYFSGSATYTKAIEVPAAWLRPGRRIYLDLGKVRDIAEVSLNGKPVGFTWAPPYRLDITAALHPGLNQLDIAVTNQWTNRQIGDSLAPPEQRVLPPTPARQPAAPSGGLFRGPQLPPESGLIADVTLVAQNSP